jgi:5-methylthioadenosine/S-adenosylhomocysteine deaminase
MNVDSSIERPVGVRQGGVSRRELLGLGALGLAGTLWPPASASADPQGEPKGSGGQPRLLLQGGIVRTLDDAIGDFSRADVLIERGRISAVAPQITPRGAKVVDCSGKVVMPGFVDTHRHMWQGLLRNMGPDDLLLDYLQTVLMGFALRLRPEEVYLGDLIAALSAMNCGITTILDWSHINTTREHTDAVIHALRDSGIRAVYGYGPNFFHPDPATNPYPKDIFRLRRRYFSSEDQLLTLALAAAGPQFAGVPSAVTEWTTARHPDVQARISVHVGVGADGPGWVKRLSDALAAGGHPGLGADTTYIHACTLTDEELALIAETGGSFSLAVPVEMQMGHGMPPIQAALDRGIPVSLSVDVETNQPTDMFFQMRQCFTLQRALKNEEHLFHFAIPDPGLEEHRAKLLTVRDVLKFATIGGARANGLDHKIGTLTPGKDADVILLDTRRINVAPVNHASGAVVLGMDCSNVDSVLIAGKFVKRHGRLVGVNVDRLLRQVENAREELMARTSASAVLGASAHHARGPAGVESIAMARRIGAGRPPAMLRPV